MGVGARVFKGRCTPAQKRAMRRAELEPVYHRIRNVSGVHHIRRRAPSAAANLIQRIFSNNARER